MNMDITKAEKQMINDAVLDYFNGWMRRGGKYNAINMLLELQRDDRAAILSYDDVRLVLKCLDVYDKDTTELEAKIKEALDEAVGR